MKRIIPVFTTMMLLVACGGDNGVTVTSLFVIEKTNCLAPCSLEVENRSQYATTYLWDFGNGDTSVEEIPTYVYTEPGTYTIELTAMNEDQRAVFSKTISVIDPSACKTVKVFYVLPSDAEHTDRQQIVAKAVERNRQLWSRDGATFIVEDVVTINSSLSSNAFLNNNDDIHNNPDWNWLGNAVNEVIAHTNVIMNDPNHKSIVFLEVDVGGFCPCAAAANFHFAGMPKWIIDRIEQGYDTEAGAIGHELGHTFGMPHENCDSQTAPKGIMCNGAGSGFGGFPDVRLTNWHFNYLFTDEHKGYFVETACE